MLLDEEDGDVGGVGRLSELHVEQGSLMLSLFGFEELWFALR
jgi:hypothetical protein